jgi:type II secretion system protein N
MAIPPASSRFPRWLVLAAYPLAAIALTLFFVFLGFPYDMLAQRIGHEVEAATSVRLRIGELSPHLGLLGPGLQASEVLAGREGQGTIALDELVVRPAWSTAWLRGIPAIHLDLTAPTGSAAGVATFGQEAGFEGSLADVDIAALPLGSLGAFDLAGRLDADVDLRRGEPEAGGGLAGSVDFALREGHFQTEDFPVAVPFERLHGRLDFGGKVYAQVSDVKLEGPMISGTIEGTVGHGPAPGSEPLAITITYEVSDPGLAPMLGGLGRRGADGRSVLQVTGTLASPVLR